MKISTTVKGDLNFLPYQPEVPINERFDWSTDVLTAHDGTEERHQNRVWPRQSYEYTIPLTKEKSTAAYNALNNALREKWAFPIWTEAQFVGNFIGGETSISCVTTPYNLKDDTLCMLFDGVNFEVLEIDTVSATSVSVYGSGVSAITNAYLMPVKVGYIDGNIKKSTNGLESKISFKFNVEDDLSFIASVPPQYGTIYAEAFLFKTNTLYSGTIEHMCSNSTNIFFIIGNTLYKSDLNGNVLLTKTIQNDSGNECLDMQCNSIFLVRSHKQKDYADYCSDLVTEFEASNLSSIDKRCCVYDSGLKNGRVNNPSDMYIWVTIGSTSTGGRQLYQCRIQDSFEFLIAKPEIPELSTNEKAFTVVLELGLGTTVFIHDYVEQKLIRYNLTFSGDLVYLETFYIGLSLKDLKFDQFNSAWGIDENYIYVFDSFFRTPMQWSLKKISYLDFNPNNKIADSNGVYGYGLAGGSLIQTGDDVYYDIPLSDKKIQKTIEQQQILTDFQLGPVDYKTNWSGSFYTSPFKAVLETPSDILEFKNFIYRRCGKFREFYTHSFENDFNILSTGVILNRLVVSSDFLIDYLDDKTNHILFTDVNGNHYPRLIRTLWRINSEKVQITLSSNLNLDASEISFASFLDLHRLNSDSIILKWIGNGVAQAEYSIVRLMK